jgi:hypothetical protein
MARRRVGEAEQNKKDTLWFMRNRRTRLIRRSGWHSRAAVSRLKDPGTSRQGGLGSKVVNTGGISHASRRGPGHTGAGGQGLSEFAGKPA